MTSRIAAVPAEDLNAFTFLDIFMINYLLDEAEHYAQFGYTPSLQAVSRSLSNPLDWLNKYTDPLQPPLPQVNTPKRESIRQEARAQYDAITQRVTAAGIEQYAATYGTSETEDEDRSIHLMSSVLTVLAADAAAQTLADKALDKSLTTEERWAYLMALYQATLIAQHYVQDPEQGDVLLKKLPQDHEIVWLRLSDHMNKAINDEFPYHSAFNALCADSGITHPSAGCHDYPAAVRFMVSRPQPDKDWELGAWHFGVSGFDLLEIIRFDHQGHRYIKLIREPYPDGYPSDLVKDQMINLLGTLVEHSDRNDSDYRTNFMTAEAMYESAARDLHTCSSVQMTGFTEDMRRELDNPAIADYLFRSVTGYNHDLGRLLATRGVGPPLLVNPEQAAAILSAGRASGLDVTQLWELAMLLGADPGDHGVAAPAIDLAALERLAEAVQKWGIPHIMMTKWGRLLEIPQDERL